MSRRKETSFLNPPVAPLVIGPLLHGVIAAQRTDEQATAYPELKDVAARLAQRSRDLGAPLVWPVCAAAERLAGAAVLLSEGGVRLQGWTDGVQGERILLVTGAGVTPIGLLQAADHARALGAAEVHACGVEVVGCGPGGIEGLFDSYVTLSPEIGTPSVPVAA